MTELVENSSKSSAASVFEDGTIGAASSIAAKRKVVPGLRFDNPNPRGRNVVRFDGIDGTTLIDRKLNVTTKSKQINDLKRMSEALRQNPEYTAVLEVPNAAVRKAAIRALDKAGVTNIGVRIAGS